MPLASITTDEQIARLALIEINRKRSSKDRLPADAVQEALYYVDQAKKTLKAQSTYDPATDATDHATRALVDYAKAHLMGVNHMQDPAFLNSAQMWLDAAAMEVYDTKEAAS